MKFGVKNVPHDKSIIFDKVFPFNETDNGRPRFKAELIKQAACWAKIFLRQRIIWCLNNVYDSPALDGHGAKNL
jgi:hypothetical protein